MNVNILRNIIFFAVLLLVQVLVLNRISMFGCATPLLYIYFLLPTKRNQPRWATLLWGFAMGLAIDIFQNTPGVAAASMTLAALLQPYLLELFVPRDSADDFQPSIRSLNTSKYVFYSLALVFVYCVTFASIEAFNFYNWQQLLLCIVGCTALTETLVLVIDNIRR